MIRKSLYFLLLPAFLACGCGYQLNGEAPSADSGYQWRSLYRQDVHTVAVPIFTNKAFSRGNEFQLTRALVQQIESITPYKVVSREQADTILEGEIVSVGVKQLSENPYSAVPQEQLLTMTVNFTWKDLRNGKILVQRKNFEQATPYYPTLGEGRFVANQEAAERLAAGIVETLQADW